MYKTKLRKGDNVQVLSGKDKGKSGSIISIFPKQNRALVKDVNVVKKHQKPSKQSAGGIINKELSIHLSNLLLLDTKSGKKTRIGFKIQDKKKVRYAKKSGEIIK
jgi:large subunit ribosomal protein L24